MGVFLVLQLALPGAAIWGSDIARFSIPYWALSIAFTLLVTLMIVARVLLMRRRIQVTLGPEYGRAYTGIAAMLIECALPYALISSVFIILYGLGSTASNLFVPLMIMVEVNTACLLPLRKAKLTFTSPCRR